MWKLAIVQICRSHEYPRTPISSKLRTGGKPSTGFTPRGLAEQAIFKKTSFRTYIFYFKYRHLLTWRRRFWPALNYEQPYMIFQKKKQYIKKKVEMKHHFLIKTRVLHFIIFKSIPADTLGKSNFEMNNYLFFQ